MTRQGELLATYSRYLGRYAESGIYSDPYRTRVWPTDRHSTAFLRDESCRMRVQALIWQTHGRPDAPAECVCFGRDWWSGRVGMKGWLRGISLSLFVIVCCTTRESRLEIAGWKTWRPADPRPASPASKQAQSVWT
jgi:hypothetical protein